MQPIGEGQAETVAFGAIGGGGRLSADYKTKSTYFGAQLGAGYVGTREGVSGQLTMHYIF